MCHEAGISEKKTNHSLRATGATALFNAGVPEKLIKDVTGHRSNALHLYERPSLQQRQEVSKVLVQGAVNKENTPQIGNHRMQRVSSNVTPQMGNHPMQRVSSNVLGSVFSGVSNCSINISPHNFTVNVCSTSQSAPEFDVNALLQGVDLETFLS